MDSIKAAKKIFWIFVIVNWLIWGGIWVAEDFSSTMILLAPLSLSLAGFIWEYNSRFPTKVATVVTLTSFVASMLITMWVSIYG
tara:strand:- start:406 stop:657 length:252 start_codon:yes stop_codon:yes gene_type:complete